MKLVFQENPKFGDEQDVIQQIRAIDEHIDKLLAEIKRFEVGTILKSKVLICFFCVFCRLISQKSIDHEHRFQSITIRHLISVLLTVPINRLVIRHNRVHHRKIEGK